MCIIARLRDKLQIFRGIIVPDGILMINYKILRQSPYEIRVHDTAASKVFVPISEIDVAFFIGNGSIDFTPLIGVHENFACFGYSSKYFSVTMDFVIWI